MKITKQAEKYHELGFSTHICTCKVCGDEFESAFSDQKYCSDECRKEANRLRAKEYSKHKKNEPPVEPQEEHQKEPQEAVNIDEANQYPTPRKYNPQRLIFTRKCCVCGQEYKTNYRHSIYCSVTCQQRKWQADKEVEHQKIIDNVDKLQKLYIKTDMELSDTKRELSKLMEELETARKKLKLADYQKLNGYTETPLEKELKETQDKLDKAEKKLAKLEAKK